MCTVKHINTQQIHNIQEKAPLAVIRRLFWCYSNFVWICGDGLVLYEFVATFLYVRFGMSSNLMTFKERGPWSLCCLLGCPRFVCITTLHLGAGANFDCGIPEALPGRLLVP